MTTTNFPKLTAVTRAVKNNGDIVYTGAFEDGSSKVIRTSAGREYNSVAQLVRPYSCTDRIVEDFVFGSKAAPTVPSFRRKYVTAIVQIAVA